MPRFRIHRMKDAAREHFRWAPHVSGAATVKPKDYELAGEVEAESEYAAWAALRQSERPLDVGDILEIMMSDGNPSGALRICKYVGFEEARWFMPEPPAAASAAPPEPVPQPAQA